MNLAKSDEIDIGGDNSDCEDETVKRLPFKNSNKAVKYLTLEDRLTFIQFWKMFIKAPIIWYFDPK